MLCDDLVADDALRDMYDGLGPVLQKVRDAQKFILSKEFTVAADGFVDNLEQLEKTISFCCAPFPLTWIEFLHDERPHWDSSRPQKTKVRPVDPTRHQGAPKRVGFLLEQLHGDPKRWTANLFWSLRSAPMNVDATSLNNVSMMSVRFDGSAESMERSMSPHLVRFGKQLLAKAVLVDPSIATRLLEYAAEDWGGETRFLIAVLGLLNARNVVKIDKVDHAETNARRARKKIRPLFSHSVLKVRPFITAGGGGKRAGAGDHVDLRLHFVRGHFKHRRTGLFWWSDHARGTPEAGVVVKDYELEH